MPSAYCILYASLLPNFQKLQTTSTQPTSPRQEREYNPEPSDNINPVRISNYHSLPCSSYLTSHLPTNPNLPLYTPLLSRTPALPQICSLLVLHAVLLCCASGYIRHWELHLSGLGKPLPAVYPVWGIRSQLRDAMHDVVDVPVGGSLPIRHWDYPGCVVVVYVGMTRARIRGTCIYKYLSLSVRATEGRPSSSSSGIFLYLCFSVMGVQMYISGVKGAD